MYVGQRYDFRRDRCGSYVGCLLFMLVFILNVYRFGSLFMFMFYGCDVRMFMVYVEGHSPLLSPHRSLCLFVLETAADCQQ